jgi:hypothetical protein
MMLNMYKAMPDLHLTIEDIIAEGRQDSVPKHLALDRHRFRQRCSFMASCFGGSRATKSPNVGQRSRRQRRESLGPLNKPTDRPRNGRVDSGDMLRTTPAQSTVRLSKARDLRLAVYSM